MVCCFFMKSLSVKWNVFFCFIQRLYNSKRWWRFQKGNWNLNLNKLLLLIVGVSYTPSSQFSHSFLNRCIRFFHRSHNTVHFGGVFALKQWIISSLKHDTVPRVTNLYCFYVKNPPKRVALWDRENSQWTFLPSYITLPRKVLMKTWSAKMPFKC